MKTLLHVPEVPIGEEWAWQTNTLVSDNGTEQRVQLLPSPKRTFSYGYVFDDASDLRTALSIGLSFGTSFQVPLFAYGTRLTAVAAAGAGALAFVASRSEMRSGGLAYVFDKAGGEIVTLNAVSAAGATLTGFLGRSYGKSAVVCPIERVFVGNNATISRNNPDNAGAASLTLQAAGFLKTFLNPYNTTALTTFAGLPVLAKNAMGTEFGSSFDTGIQPLDYGGVVEIRSPWQHAQIVMPRSFLCNRMADPADWAWWRAFADYCRGSQKPFFMPTYRRDFDLHTAPAPGGTTLTFEGTDYATDWFPNAPFKTLAIFTAGGVHYTTVTAAVAAGGNTNVTFNPALPAGGAWAQDQAVSLLLKVRIADDKVSCQHQSLHTVLTLTLRTVDA